MSSTILGGDVTIYWSTDNNQLRMEWTGAATDTRTMNEVYSAWKTLEALSANMSERVGMTAQTPVDYTMVNQYFVDDTTMEFMTGGTLQSSGWGTNEIVQVEYTDTSGFAGSDIGLTVTTSSYSGTILDYNDITTTQHVWIRPDDPATDDFDLAEAMAVTGGTATPGSVVVSTNLFGESVWANPTTIATLADDTRVYIYQSRSLTAPLAGADDKAEVIATKGTDKWWGDGNIDICLKVQNADSLFDEGFATFFARQYTKTYSHAVTDLSAGARTPIALETSDDINATEGFRQFLTDAETGAGWSSADVGERINEDIATPTWEAVLTSVSGTGPNYTMQYYPVADLTDASALDQFEDLAATKDATITAAAPTSVNAEAAPDNTLTIVHANTSQDLNNGNGAQPYSITVDLQSTIPIQSGYNRGNFETRRGETGTTETDGIEGEQYIGNELHLNYSSLVGSFSEGEQLWMFNTGDTIKVATGFVVADHGAAADGGLQMRNVRRYTSDTIGLVGDSETSYATATDDAVVDTERTITPVKTAPFGTFAGGTWFGAPGVWFANIFAGDEQSISLTDDLGATQSPPNTVSVNVTNLLSGDSVAVYRRVSTDPGSDIDRAEYNPNGAQGPATTTTAGTATLTISGAATNEVPDAGKVKVVDVSNNNETIRYRYTSVNRTADAVFTLTASTGTADAGGSATLLEDAAADFVTDGVEVGDIARNITSGGEAIVTGITDLDTLTTTTLDIGTWATGESYEINILARPYLAGDDVWVPFVDRVADATNESNSMIHTVDIPVRVVIRRATATFIDPESFDQTITTGGMEQAAIRNTDTIKT